jgi:hypothetical protein
MAKIFSTGYGMGTVWYSYVVCTLYGYGHGRKITYNQLESEVWCRLDDELQPWR